LAVLADFVLENRDAIIVNARARVASRKSPQPSAAELENGVPAFLDQLAAALRLAESTDVVDHDQIDVSAGRHGQDLLRLGLTVGQVVHDYGDVCQAITALAVAQQLPIATEEFRTLNLCLDDAIAGAVSAYSLQRERGIEARGTERLGVLAHEMRNLLNTAMLAFETIRRGTVAIGGSTGSVLNRSLTGLRDLIDRSLADVRLDVGIERLEPISVVEFVEEIEIAGRMQADAMGMHLTVTTVEATAMIEGDRQLLAAVIANMLQNAFKFSRRRGHVSFVARATADRVLFEVEDECGGLPAEKIAQLFQPFKQHGPNRTGVGLGLSICMRAAKANGGEMRVRDIPGKGCVFVLDMPRKPIPPLVSIDGGKRDGRGGGAATSSG
jgi:signal transduction histidine kinase